MNKESLGWGLAGCFFFSWDNPQCSLLANPDTLGLSSASGPLRETHRRERIRDQVKTLQKKTVGFETEGFPI